MTSYSVIITEQADKDIDSIGLYILEELHNPTAAERFLALIDKRILELEIFPKMHSLIQNERLQNYRKIHVMNYIIFYTVNDISRTATVQRILYCRRDWLNILYRDQ